MNQQLLELVKESGIVKMIENNVRDFEQIEHSKKYNPVLKELIQYNRQKSYLLIYSEGTTESPYLNPIYCYSGNMKEIQDTIKDYSYKDEVNQIISFDVGGDLRVGGKVSRGYEEHKYSQKYYENGSFVEKFLDWYQRGSF